jgi:adenylate cyclase class 2
MLEVEVKAHVKDLEALEDRLSGLRARYLGEEEQVDLYFNHPTRDFALTDEALRLRRTGDTLFLTYKGPKLDELTKTRREYEVEVKDYSEAKNILMALGFTPVREVRKTRRLYTYEDYVILLDRVRDLGNFVEVEGRGDMRPEKLLAFLKELGIPPEKSERRSYLELLMYKKANPGP